MNTSTKWILTIAALALAACVCLSVICVAGAGLVFWQQSEVKVPPTPELGGILPTELAPTEQPSLEGLPSPTPPPTAEAPENNLPEVTVSVDVAVETLNTLRRGDRAGQRPDPAGGTPQG